MNHYDRGMSAFDGLFVPAELRAAVSQRAWLEAMLDAERALCVLAGASAGTVPADIATEIAAACDPGRFDFEQLAAEEPCGRQPPPSRSYALSTGLVGDEAATTCTGARRARTSWTRPRCSSRGGRWRSYSRKQTTWRLPPHRWPRDHRDTLMVARTILQHAVPTTFGLRQLRLADRDRRGARAARAGPRSGSLRNSAGPPGRWRGSATAESHCSTSAHGARPACADPPVAHEAGRASPSSARLSPPLPVSPPKIALDLVLLAQTEVGEVAEGTAPRPFPRRCRRSATRSARRARPRERAARHGSHAGVLIGSLEQEHERAAGAWQAEWPALAGALAHTGRCAAPPSRAPSSRSRSDSTRMRQNLDLTGGLVMAERVAFLLMDQAGPGGGAGDRARGGCVRDELPGRALADARTGLEPAALDAALDPYLSPGRGRARRPRARALRELAAADRGRCVTLHYRLDGPHGAPPLMLCNSLGTTLEMWDQQVAPLTAQFRLVRYDRRGHGRSPSLPAPIRSRIWVETFSTCSTISASNESRSAASRSGDGRRMWLASKRAGADRPPRPLLRGTEPAAARRSGWSVPRQYARRGVAAIADAALDRWFTPLAPDSLRQSFRTMLVADTGRGICGLLARRWPTSTCATGSVRSKPDARRHGRRRSRCTA